MKKGELLLLTILCLWTVPNYPTDEEYVLVQYGKPAEKEQALAGLGAARSPEEVSDQNEQRQPASGVSVLHSRCEKEPTCAELALTIVLLALDKMPWIFV